MIRGWLCPEEYVQEGGKHPTPQHLVEATKRTVGIRAVGILLECFLVVPMFTFTNLLLDYIYG